MSWPSGSVQVHLRQVPVRLWSQAQQLTDELLREFALAAAQADEDEDPHVPARLSALVDTLSSQFAGVGTAQEEELSAAAARGQEVVDDLVFLVPPEAAAASTALGDLLDEADDYCREGHHLLTLAAPAEIVAFRHWYLGSFIRQVAGAAPVPWPEYDGSWA